METELYQRLLLLVCNGHEYRDLWVKVDSLRQVPARGQLDLGAV